MSHANRSVSRFRYQVESKALAQGGRAWSIFEELPDGARIVLASGAMLGEAGESWDHDTLMSFLEKAESRRHSIN